MPAATSLSSTVTLQNVISTRGLAAALGVDYAKEFSFVLYRLIPTQNFRTFTIPKRGGGTRTIAAPRRGLRKLQLRLLPLLAELYDAPPCVMAHVKGRSIIENAAVHARRRYIVNFDLQQFYDSIHFSRIVGILASPRYRLRPDVAKAIAQIACYDGKLATGGAVSGMLANMVAGPLDSALLRFAKRNRLRYTRYVDDITLSTNNRQGADVCLAERSNGQHFLTGEGVLSPTLVSLVSSHGFEVHPRKVFFSSRAVRQQVTNITTNERLNVPRSMIRSIRGALHSIEKFGLDAAQEEYTSRHRPSENSGTSLRERLRGQLLYVGQVTQGGVVYRRLAERANTAVPGLGLPLGVSDVEAATLVAERGSDQATAFHIGRGLFITAAHAFGAGESVRLMGPQGTPDFQADEVHRNDRLDFSILKARDEGAATLPSLRLSRRKAGSGDQVVAYGFVNWRPGNSISAIQTSITGHSVRLGARRQDVAHRLEHGASGGPVLSVTGRVIGIVHGGPDREDDDPVANSITPAAGIAEVAQALLETA